jgi:hypothetical protein
VGVALYQFICGVHGPCSTAPIRRNSAATERHCPRCGRVAELWVGETAPAMSAVRGAPVMVDLNAPANDGAGIALGGA